MNLLFDQNLSVKLIKMLADIFPAALHTEIAGLGQSDDSTVRDFARQNDYIIVTKDADFNELNILFGFPPKIIWIKRGNCTTKEIETLLRHNKSTIEAFILDNELSVLTLF